MAEINSFIFHLDSMEVLSDLSTEEVGTLFLAMVEFQKTGKEPQFNDRALRTAWRHLSRRIKEDNAAYLEKCKTNQENGKLGGAPRGNRNAAKNNRTVEKTTERLSEQPKTTEDNPNQAKQPYTDPYPYPDPYPYNSQDLQVIGDLKVDDGGIIIVPLASGKEYVITPKRIAELQKVFTEINVRRELTIMAEVMRTDPSKRRTDTRIDITINNWLQNARGKAIGQDKVAAAKAPKKKLTPAEEVDTWKITL